MKIIITKELIESCKIACKGITSACLCPVAQAVNPHLPSGQYATCIGTETSIYEGTRRVHHFNTTEAVRKFVFAFDDYSNHGGPAPEPIEFEL